MRQFKVWIVAVAMVVAGVVPAFASGFSVYEQSTKASGLAGAWVAQADDPAANWYNPAALVRLNGTQAGLGVNFITIGIDTTLTANDPVWGTGKFDTKQNNVTPAHVYWSQQINDRLYFGFGLNNPFGLVSEWQDRPVTFVSKRVELVTWNVNPNLAYKINDAWSVAVGLDYLKADVKAFSKEIDQSPLLKLPAGTVVGQSNLTGSGDDWGWNLALLWKSDPMAFGFTYRSALSPNIAGQIEFTDIYYALQLAELFPDGPGTTSIDLPAQAAVGFSYEIDKDWLLEADVSWAQWSRFKSLDVDIENETSVILPESNTVVPVVQDIHLVEDWKDTFAVRLGATWKWTDAHHFRMGAVYDKNPIPDNTLRPSIPDADRFSITLGYGFNAKKWNLDAYYMPLFFMDRSAQGEAEGVIDGDYSSFVHLLGVGFTYRF